jgi:hypothetical protein
MKRETSSQAYERLDAKCRLLEDFGFEIYHRDSDVRHVCWDDIRFDFSATASDFKSILYTALKTIHEAGVKGGEQRVQSSIRKALGFEEE